MRSWLAAVLLCGCAATNEGGTQGNCGRSCDNESLLSIAKIDPKRDCEGSPCVVPVSQAIMVEFSEVVRSMTITGGTPDCGGTFTLAKQSGGPCVAGSIAVTGATAVFTPSAALEVASVYDVFLSGMIADRFGNLLMVDERWSFRTEMTQVCGDGVMGGTEACDDGNTVDGDYCSFDCTRPLGFCGDGVLQNSVEQCDDNNGAPGDGCSASCRTEIREPAAIAGDSMSCGIRADGTLACWGAGAAAPPSGIFIDLAVADAIACAVDMAGALSCWGGAGDTSIPGTYDAVDMGGAHLCGIDTAGTVQCLSIDAAVPALSAPDGTFVQISVGAGHACGVTDDGTAVCWGDDSEGQATVPEGFSFVAMSAGEDHSCGLRDDGSLVCFGGGVSATPPEGPFDSIAAGKGHTCGLKQTGAVVCWNNGGGASGMPTSSNFVQLSAGRDINCGVTDAFEAQCWSSTGDAHEDLPPNFP